MKFYKAGRKIRTIEELEEGKMYSVCGVVGVLLLVPTLNGDFAYKFMDEGEAIMLLMHRNAIIDRVHLGMVHAILKEFKPREKTLASLYYPVKK